MKYAVIYRDDCFYLGEYGGTETITQFDLSAMDSPIFYLATPSIHEEGGIRFVPISSRTERELLMSFSQSEMREIYKKLIDIKFHFEVLDDEV